MTHTTDELFTDADLCGFDQTDMFEAIETQLAEDRAEAVRRSVGIRAMITADLPAGAADRWAHAFGIEPAPEAEDGMHLSVVVTSGGVLRVHASTCSEVPKENAWFSHGLFTRTATNRAAVVESTGTDAGWFVWHHCVNALAETDPADVDETETETTERVELVEGDELVDLDALRLSARMRDMVCNIDGEWHYWTRNALMDRGLAEWTTDGEALQLTELGERVRRRLGA